MELGGLPDEQRDRLGSAGPMSRPRYQGTTREMSDPLLGATVCNIRIDTGITRQSLQVGTRSQAGSPIEVGPHRRTGMRDGEVHPRGEYRQGSVFPMTLVTGGAQRPTRGYSMPLAEPPCYDSTWTRAPSRSPRLISSLLCLFLFLSIVFAHRHRECLVIRFRYALCPMIRYWLC